MNVKTALLFAATAAFFTPYAQAQTGCDEWAAMTQVLVMRWQKDPHFEKKTLDEVKNELKKSMGKHPEINKAIEYVEFAYQHKDDDYRFIYKTAYNKCTAIEL